MGYANSPRVERIPIGKPDEYHTACVLLFEESDLHSHPVQSSSSSSSSSLRFFVFLLYVVGFHHVLGIKLWMDWGIPHKLILGWN